MHVHAYTYTHMCVYNILVDGIKDSTYDANSRMRFKTHPRPHAQVPAHFYDDDDDEDEDDIPEMCTIERLFDVRLLLFFNH